MLDDLLMELARRAMAEQAVAQAAVDGDLHMLVYPLDQGLLVGLGLEGGRAGRATATTILSRRGADMARCGLWLPALLKDGSWYLFRHVTALPSPALTADDLAAAAWMLA